MAKKGESKYPELKGLSGNEYISAWGKLNRKRLARLARERRKRPGYVPSPAQIKHDKEQHEAALKRAKKHCKCKHCGVPLDPVNASGSLINWTIRVCKPCLIKNRKACDKRSRNARIKSGRLKQVTEVWRKKNYKKHKESPLYAANTFVKGSPLSMSDIPQTLRDTYAIKLKLTRKLRKDCLEKAKETILENGHKLPSRGNMSDHAYNQQLKYQSKMILKKIERERFLKEHGDEHPKCRKCGSPDLRMFKDLSYRAWGRIVCQKCTEERNEHLRKIRYAAFRKANPIKKRINPKHPSLAGLSGKEYRKAYHILLKTKNSQ